MTKQKRYLITTADERTWEFDRPVIFLGEWCLHYKRKKIWQNMDSVISDSYGLNLSKKKSDYNEAKKLEDKLFPELCELLNQQHNSSYSKRFWWILLGPWYKRIVKLILNRVNTLKKCLEKYEISGTSTYINNSYALSSANSLLAYESFNNNKWNNILNYKILDLIEEVKFPVKFLNLETNFDHYPNSNSKILINKKSYKDYILKWAFKHYCRIARKFIREDDAFIINSYLPLKEEIKLELALGQLPQLWKLQWNKILTWPKATKKFDKILRKTLNKKFSYKSENNLENIVRSLLFELLPDCYLEGFENLQNIVHHQPWPKSPKFIFTSSNYNSDDVFKLWTANQVESGTKYYIGQHGNSYGTRWDNVDCIEEVTPDKFITWGWTDGSEKHLPTFIFNTLGRVEKNYSSQGGLLLIETICWNRYTTWDSSSEFVEYLNDQKKFVNNLNSLIRQEITIRLHPGSRQDTWNEDERWFDFDPKIKIDYANSDIKDLISKSRLVIHSYDSTGILVTLSQNIPTLAFWQDGFDHLRESAKPYYQLLVDVGIIHLSAKSASDKVNKIWNDVDSWWHQTQVQDARKFFCERYAKIEQKSISKLKKVLLS